MNCPPEVAAAMLSILQTGLLRIRAAGWSNDPGRCAIESDHLHNIPALLANFSPDLFRYYWDVERTAYLAQVGPENAAAFADAWKLLEACTVAAAATG